MADAVAAPAAPASAPPPAAPPPAAAAAPPAPPPVAAPPAAPAAPPAPGEPAAPSPAAAPAAGPARGPDGKFLPKAGEAPAATAADAPLLAVDWKPTAPAGVKLDDGLLGSFRGIMADPKLSHADRAQKLVDLQIQANAAQERANAEILQRQRHADLEQLKGDPEYGGAKFDQTRAQVRSILEKTKYGPAVSKKLEAVGLDCDPDFTRFLAEVRSVIAEDSTSSRLTSPTPGSNGAPMSQLDRQAATYSNQPKR
jgi:hypothetical protein